MKNLHPVAVIIFVVVRASLVILDNLNPFGLGLRLFEGMRPPYHWVNVDMTGRTEGSIEMIRLDSKGKECAYLYKFTSLSSHFMVYGFGFYETYDTLNAAKERAEKECR